MSKLTYTESLKQLLKLLYQKDYVNRTLTKVKRDIIRRANGESHKTEAYTLYYVKSSKIKSHKRGGHFAVRFHK